jgi:hypothetical protein
MDVERASDRVRDVARAEPIEILLLDLQRGPAAVETLVRGLERGLEAMQSIRAQISVREGSRPAVLG